MKPSQVPWKWLLFGLLLVWLAGISLIPHLIGDTSRFGDRIAQRLSAWSGGKVEFTGPVHVTLFPDVSVRGPLRMSRSTALPFQSLEAKEAKASLDLLQLLRGNISIDVLRLQKPRVDLRDERQAPQPANAIAAKLFAGAPVRVLSIRNGRINRAGSRPIKDLYLQLDAGRDSGAVSGSGSFAFNRETVRYTLKSGSPKTAEGGEQIPVVVTIASAPLNAKLSGTASFADQFKIDGDMDAEFGSLRSFLRWIGFGVADGESLKGLSMAGNFHYADGTLTFDDGAFTLDGNRAKGALALTFSSRPRIEGTLAFDRLVLDPYFRRAADGGAAPTRGSNLLFERSLLRLFDADLRISGAEIVASPLKLGRGGFTISSKNGSVTSEIGELELCGGIAEGRVTIDLAPASEEVNLVADLADVAIEPCLAPLALAAKLSGTGALKAELSGRGSSIEEIAGNLGGTLKLDARDGSVPVDFAKLLANKVTLTGNGWIGDGRSAFDELKAECRLSAGQIWCETLDMRSPRERVAGAGDINLSRKTLNWNLSVGKPGLSEKETEMPAAATPELSIRGPLSQPMIQRTDRQTLEEGSMSASPLEHSTTPQ